MAIFTKLATFEFSMLASTPNMRPISVTRTLIKVEVKFKNCNAMQQLIDILESGSIKGDG